MRIVRMFICGVAILSLLCIFSLSMANAQGRLEFDGEAKLMVTLVETLTTKKVVELEKFYIRFKYWDDPSGCEAIEYDIYAVDKNTCKLTPIGWVYTCGGRERTA